MSTAPIAFIDTETDGVHPGRKLWEIAIVRREPDGTETAWEAMVRIDLSTADPFGLRVGRFYDRHPLGRSLAAGVDKDSLVDAVAELDDLWTHEEVAPTVARLTHGAHLVGAVPNFDAELLDRLLRRGGLCPSWHYHLVDVENLAVGFLAGRGLQLSPPWNSDNLAEALEVGAIGEGERHTAMGDVRWAMRIYDRITTGLPA